MNTVAETVLAFRRSQPAAPSFDAAVERGRQQRLESPLLPGFALDLGALFGAVS